MCVCSVCSACSVCVFVCVCRTGALAVELVLARLAVLLPVTQPLAGDAEVVVATELVGRAVAHTVFL